jgi:putative hemolysin
VIPGLEALPDFDGGPGTIAVLAAMLAASFVFAGTETAFLALQKPDRERFARGSATQRRVMTLWSQRARFTTAVQLGHELSNTLVAATAAALFAALAPGHPWLPLAVVPLALALISEITPKVIAWRFAPTWTQLAAWPFTVWNWLATPARAVFGGLVTLVQRLLGAQDADDTLAEDELMVYVDRGARVGELAPSERDIIEAVFEFDDLHVGRLMTPRHDVVSVPVTVSWEALLETARTSGCSRLPVTGSGPDDILGVLLVKDLLKFRSGRLRSPKQLRSMLLPPVFVPASKMADTLLREFLERRFHLAFVVDEHGTLIGLVTLDDLLAELVGGQDDVSAEPDIERRADTLTVKGSIDLEDLQEETGIAVPTGDYHTLGGYVFHQLGRLPRRGDVVTGGGHQFVVTGMEGRRVAELLVRPVAATPPGEAR